MIKTQNKTPHSNRNCRRSLTARPAGSCVSRLEADVVLDLAVDTDRALLPTMGGAVLEGAAALAATEGVSF